MTQEEKMEELLDEVGRLNNIIDSLYKEIARYRAKLNLEI
jgi:hypothetical protein